MRPVNPCFHCLPEKGQNPGLFSSDTADVAAGNPNVGQFTVAQKGKLLHVAPISLPFPDESDEW
jgi:hypothetical protein